MAYFNETSKLLSTPYEHPQTSFNLILILVVVFLLFIFSLMTIHTIIRCILKNHKNDPTRTIFTI